jgi:hypothetical protein
MLLTPPPPAFHNFHLASNTTMPSLYLTQVYSHWQLPQSIEIAANNARSPTCAGTTTQSNSMHQTASLRRKMTSCRWRSSPCSQSIPFIPTRTHGQRWDSCQRRTITTDAAPLLPQRSEDHIDYSLACVGGKAPKRVVPAALPERKSQRKVQITATTA